MTLETLGQAAVCRNLLVADLLGRVGLGERAGTGIERMRVEALSQGYPEPEFKEDTFVTVVFRPIPKPSQTESSKAAKNQRNKSFQVLIFDL